MTQLEPPPYPVTPVLRGSAGPDGEVMTEEELTSILAGGPFRVQEKLDGINIGVSPGPAPTITFKKLWLARIATDAGMKIDQVLNGLRRLPKQAQASFLYFEWVDPGQLHTPSASGWFLIDIREKRSGRFLASHRVDQVASLLGVARPPQLGSVRLRSVTELQRLMGASQVAHGLAEGVILRRERNEHVVERYKFVRPGHRQQNGGPIW